LIHLFEPNITVEPEIASGIIKSGFWASGSSMMVKTFEDKLAEYLGCKNVVAVNSGTAALHLALSLLDIKGKEVILPALSFVSTANAILYNGGIPVFADVEEDTLCLDPDKLPLSIDTECIIPVHFGGMFSKNIDGKGCKIVNDSAHRIERNGNVGISCYSFHPVKNLAMPCGGAIAGDFSVAQLDKLRARRWCGIQDRTAYGYDVKELGWNYYMNEISAAIGLVQLEKLDDMNLRRRQMAHAYHNELKFPNMPFSMDCSYHLYWIRVKNRDQFRKKMLEAGIETGTHYTPINQFTLYNECGSQPPTPITDKVAQEIVTLPMHTNLTDSDIDHIIKTCNKC